MSIATALRTAIGRKGAGLLYASRSDSDLVWLADGHLSSLQGATALKVGDDFVSFEGIDGPIGDQGATNECVGEMASALMTIMESIAGLPLDPASPRAAYRQSVRAHTADGATLLDGGTYLRSCLSQVSKRGCPSLAMWPRNSLKVMAPIPAGIRAMGAERRGLRYEFLRTATNAAMLDLVDAAIASHRPVGYGGPVTQRYQRHRGSVPFDARLRKSDVIVGGHARVQVSMRREDGAYRERNSWGLGWGDGGYAWMLADTVDRSDVVVVSGWARINPEAVR